MQGVKKIVKIVSVLKVKRPNLVPGGDIKMKHTDKKTKKTDIRTFM
jgi:hypothetical protein